MYENRKVKVYFCNGITCEGIVAEWDADKGFGLLKSLEGNDYLHLYDVNKNVQMVRVCDVDIKAQKEPEEDVPAKPLTPAQPAPVITKPVPRRVVARKPKAVSEDLRKPIVEPPTPELDQKITDQQLRLKKLAELRAIQKKTLEEQIAQKKTSHQMTDISRPIYASPDFTKRIT